MASRRCLLGSAVLGQVPVDQTSPRIALNQESTDVQTKLDLLQQELYQEQQQVMYLTLLRLYDDKIMIRRSLFPSEKELVPGYVFSPKPLDKSKRYPGLIIVHGAFHGHLDWRFFDLIDYAVSKGHVVMFPEYRASSGCGDVQYKNH